MSRRASTKHVCDLGGYAQWRPSWYTRAAEGQQRFRQGRCVGCIQPWEDRACPFSRRKKAGDAPPTAGFFSWLPDLPAPGRPGGSAPLGFAALLPTTGPLVPARRAAIAIAAPDILVPRMETGLENSADPRRARHALLPGFVHGVHVHSESGSRAPSVRGAPGVVLRAVGLRRPFGSVLERKVNSPLSLNLGHSCGGSRGLHTSNRCFQRNPFPVRSRRRRGAGSSALQIRPSTS